MAQQFKRKYQMQKYDPEIAFATPGFHEALRYYVRQMRVADFVRAHDRLHAKHGPRVSHEAELYCFHMGITIRAANGKLYLADGYEKRLP